MGLITEESESMLLEVHHSAGIRLHPRRSVKIQRAQNVRLRNWCGRDEF